MKMEQLFWHKAGSSRYIAGNGVAGFLIARNGRLWHWNARPNDRRGLAGGVTETLREAKAKANSQAREKRYH